jgi:hypothetical protein
MPDDELEELRRMDAVIGIDDDVRELSVASLYASHLMISSAMAGTPVTALKFFESPGLALDHDDQFEPASFFFAADDGRYYQVTVQQVTNPQLLQSLPNRRWS